MLVCQFNFQSQANMDKDKRNLFLIVSAVFVVLVVYFSIDMMSKTTPPWKRKKTPADSLVDLRFDRSLFPDTAIFVYKVQKGEVIGIIADKFNWKADSIRSFNELATDNLKENQSLLLRIRAVHTVAKGEFLEKIARKYQTEVKPIMRANNMKKAEVLRADQKIVIPIPK